MSEKKKNGTGWLLFTLVVVILGAILLLGILNDFKFN